jgi:hypothetical protein
VVDLKTACAWFFVTAVSPGLAGVAAAAEQGRVPVYDATQVAFDRYVVVKRVGIDDWRSAFRIKGHADLAAATQAVLNEAARVGADGVTNLMCFDQTDALFNPAGYFCYGNAIRLKR